MVPFTTGQFNEFIDFSKIQEQDVRDRITWLKRQLDLNGSFSTVYDDDDTNPVSFSCGPPYSYGAKLLQAYKILGGSPEKDMLLRTSDKPVYLTRGVNIDDNPTSGYSETFSNGRRFRGNQRFDRDIGLKVQKLKSWQLEIIKRKREHLEFKIKRCLDYSDQLQIEVNTLSRMIDDSNERSVDMQVASIKGDMFAIGSMNVVDSGDMYGLSIGQVGDKTNPHDIESEQAEGLRGLNDGKGVPV